jgi:hypothetical protein
LAAPTAEGEQLPAERVMTEMQLHQGRKPIEALALMWCTT